MEEVIEVSPRRQLRLYDVAQFRGINAQSLEVFKSFVISLKADNSPLEISRSEFVNLLRQQLSQLDAKYSLKLPNQITIQFSKENISMKEVERKLKNQLHSLCDACRFNLRISKLPNYQNPDWELDFSSLKDRGSFLLPLEKEGFWISGMTKTEKKVLVSLTSIRAQSKLQKRDVALEYRDVTFAKDFFEDDMRIEDMKSRGMIPAQTVLQSHLLEREPLAVRGQMLKVIAGDSLYEITTQGVSNGQGFLGDVINLQLINSKKVISGEIIDKGTVKIQ